MTRMSKPDKETAEILETEAHTSPPPSTTQQDEHLLEMIQRNIASLKRETQRGTKVDPSSIRDLERQYRELADSLRSRRYGG